MGKRNTAKGELVKLEDIKLIRKPGTEGKFDPAAGELLLWDSTLHGPLPDDHISYERTEAGLVVVHHLVATDPMGNRLVKHPLED